MKKDTKRKTRLGAEKLEKREAPFMAITQQDDGGGGGTTQDRDTVNRDVQEETPRIAQDDGGAFRRTRLHRREI